MTGARWPHVCTYGHQWDGAAQWPDDRREGCPVCALNSIPTNYYAAGVQWADEMTDDVRAIVEAGTGDPLAADLAMTCHEIARYLLAMVAQLGTGDYDPADVLPRDWAYLQATGLTDAVRTWADAVGVAID
jgi:hypothetical protein